MVLAVKAERIRIGYMGEDDEILWAVRDVSLEVNEGDSFCIVGESGSGKTTLGNLIAGILPPHAITYGRLYIFNNLVVEDNTRRFNDVRGKIVSYIPQNPGTSLNPYLTIEEHFYYVLRDLKGFSRSKAREEAIEALLKVGLNPSVLEDYPHELSGGMQQRVLVAIALVSNAKIIVADEPTSSIDANLRLGILNLLNKLNKDYKLTLIIITHDIGVANVACNKIGVMLSGKIIEYGDTRHVLEKPSHPYTKMLLDCIPILGVKKPLKPLPGEPVQVYVDIEECPFRNRCLYAIEACSRDPPLVQVNGLNHYTKCWRVKEGYVPWAQSTL